jgi:hypothetical protein
MSIHDRDYYRDEVARKTGGKRPLQSQGSDMLNNVISETAKRPKKPRSATLFRKPLLLAKRYEPIRQSEPIQQKRSLPKAVIVLIWVCVVAVLYGAFTLAKH